MTQEQVQKLLQPRYLVIADYPSSTFTVGEILPIIVNEMGEAIYAYPNTGGKAGIYQTHFNKYPHIFKPLFWWEERDIADMPEYLKWQTNGKVRKVKEYRMMFNPPVVEFEGGRTRKLRQEWTIATSEEYNDYKQQTK